MRKKIFLPLAFCFIVLFTLGIYFFRNSNSEEYIQEPIESLKVECFEESSPIPWAYCLYKVPNSDNPDVLYDLHARNGDETWWNDKNYHTGKLYEYWEKSGKSAPTVVSISFGKVWVLTEDESVTEGGLYNIFNTVVIPTVESKLKDHSGKRMIEGISMGGFNTLIVAMKSKGFFSKVAALCPPLSTISHHSSLTNIVRNYFEGDASLKRFLMLWEFSRRYYPTEKVWLDNDPFQLSKSFSSEGHPEIYITCGKKDTWGGFKVAEKLAQNIKITGGTIEWVPREGGHGDIDYQSLADFLQN